MNSAIAGILNRAHEIHRAHGGVIGYDLEDWLEAERELYEKTRLERFQPEGSVHQEPFPRGQQASIESEEE